MRPILKPGHFNYNNSVVTESNQNIGESQYDSHITPDTENQLNEIRAQKQTRLDKLGNGLFNFGSTVLTSAAENMVGLPVGMISAMVEQDPAALYNNAFTREFIDPIKDWSRENMPFYSSEAEQNAGLLEGMKYSNFWFDKVFGGVGYTVGAMVSGMGLSKMYGLGKLATAGKLAEGAEGVLSNIGKSNRMLGFINKDAGKELMIGLGMAHGESAAEARDTYNTMIQNGYTQAEAEAAANKNYVTNLFITGATNYALLRKTFRPSYKDAVELNAVRSVETKGEDNVVKSLLEDATLSDKNRYVKGRAIKFLEGVAEEGGQEGAQFASDQLWRKYEALQNDPKTKDQAGNFMNALGEALSETFGSKEGLENILIGGITGGPFGLKGVRGEMQRKEQLTKKYVDALNADPEFKNLVYGDILTRSNQKLKLGDAVSAIAFFDKADEAMLKGDKFNYHNAKFNGLAQVVKMMSENNTLGVFKERLEAMKELDLDSFSQQFDAKPKDTAEQHEQIDTLLKSIDSIEKSYNQTREFFNMNKYQGDTQDPLDVELNKIVFDQLFFSSVNLNNIEEREKAVAKEIKAISHEADALLRMREFAFNNTSLTDEELKNEWPQLYKDFIKDSVSLDYDKFRKELGDSYRTKFNESLKKFSEKNPHIAPKLNELLGDLNKLAEAREAFIENYNKLTTVEGRKELRKTVDGTKEKALAEIKQAKENFEKKSPVSQGDINKLGNKEAVQKMREANLAAVNADNEPDLQDALAKIEAGGLTPNPEVVEAKKQEIAENQKKAEQQNQKNIAGIEQSIKEKFIGSSNFLNSATINSEQRELFNKAFNSPNFLDRISIRVRPAQYNAPYTIKELNDKLNQKSTPIDVEILFDGNPQPIAFLNWYGRYTPKTGNNIPISLMSNAEINNLFNLPDGVTPEQFKQAYEANQKFYNYLESLLGDKSEINLSNEELKALTNITGTRGMFNSLGYNSPKSPLEQFKDRLIKNEHGQFIILDRHGYSFVDGEMKRLSENTPRSFGNALLDDENNLNPIYTQLVEKIKELNDSGKLKDRYVTLFEDAGGTIIVGDKTYSILPITPSKVQNTQSIVTELLTKAEEISNQNIDAEELDAWNKEFNDKFFISNSVNSIVQIELGFQGKCRINFYKDKVASNIIIDLNKVQFIDDIIEQVDKTFKKSAELANSGAKDVKQYKELIENFQPIKEKNFKVVVAEKSQVGNVAADEELLKQFETPFGQNIKINQELSFDFKNVPTVNKPQATSAPTEDIIEDDEDEELPDEALAQIFKKPSAPVSNEVNDLFNSQDEDEDNTDDKNIAGKLKDALVKPGVSELFESNPELANNVYEALGVEVNNFKLQSNEKAFGEPHLEGANSYDIFYKGNKIGKIALFDGKNPMIKGLELNESERNKGLGKALYKWLNYKATLKGGRLYADQEFISPDAQRVWESLNKEGLVDLTGNSPKFNDKQKQQALQLYSQYLDTIFPDSQVKDIVYHGTDTKFDAVDVSKSKFQKGFYFAKDKSIAEGYGNTLALLVDSKNIQVQPFAHFGYYVDSKELLNKELLKINSLLQKGDFKNALALQLIDVTDEIKFFKSKEEKEDYKKSNSGWENVEESFLKNKAKELNTLIQNINKQGEFDTMLTHNDDGQLSLYAVGKPEQIHLLGSKQDIEGFKKFTNNQIVAKTKSDTINQEWVDHKTAVANITSILPNGVDVALLDKLVSNVFDKNDLMGAFMEDTVYLGESMQKGTEYHEAFHAVFRTAMNDSEITFYLQVAKNEMRNELAKSGKSFVQAVAEFKADPRNVNLISRLTKEEIEDLVIEEYMADKFMAYKNTANKPKTGLAKLFEMILDFFNIFKSNEDQLSLLFKRIDKGQYRNKSSVDNRFSKSKNVVSALIKTDRKGGTLNPEIQNNLINTIASSVLNKLEEDKNKSVSVLINEALAENAAPYDPRNYTGLSDETQLFLAKQFFARDGVGNNPKARKIITDSVLKLLKSFDIDEDTTELEYAEDELGNKSHVLNAENYGGFGSLSKEIRRDIALTTYTTTLNVLYNRRDLPDVEITSGVDTKKVYDGLVKATANSISDNLLIDRFMGYAEHSEQAKHYINKVISKSGFENGEQGYTINEAQRNYFQRVLKAFNLFSVDHRFLALDPGNKTSRMMSANQRGMDTEQLITWAANFNDNYRGAFATPDGIAKLAEKFNNINNLLSGGYRPGVQNTKLNVKQLNERVDKLFYALQDVKIDLCKGYIKYLLLTHSGRMADGLLTKEQKEFVENYQDEFEVDNSSFAEHITQIAGVISRGSNPFTKEVDKQKDEDKESAVSRLKMLARDNAILDERVAVTNFKNAENKSVYAYQQPTFHLIKAIELRNESNSQIKKRIAEYKNDTERYADRRKDNSLGNTYATVEKFRLDNQLSLSEAYKKIQKKLVIIRADGGRVTKLFSKNGQLEEVSNIDRQEGVTFGKFTKRDFILYNYGLYLDRSTHNGVVTSPVILPIMEASSTLDHVDLPSIQCFNSKEGITHTFTSSIYKEIERELGRITDFRNGLFEREIDGYTTGSRPRASYFWKWEKLLLTNLTQEQINKIANGEESLELHRDLIEKSIHDYFTSELDQHIKMLEDEGIIDYNSKENKHYSKLLDKRFYTGRDNAKYLDGMDAVFNDGNIRANISQVYLSNYLNTMFFCQLLEGDPALNAKDTTDFFKRQRGANGAGPSFSGTHLKSDINYLVLQDAKAALPVKNGKLDYSSTETTNVDKADAQANGTSQMFIHILDSLGRYDSAIKPIIAKLDDVDSPELTYEEQKKLKEYMAIANSYKIQGYDDKGQYLKTSVQFLFKKNLYYRSTDGTIKPKTKHMSLVKMYEAMEQSGAVLCGPKSFSKKATYGVSKTQFDNNGEITSIEPQLQKIEARFLRLQMENPALKEEGKDPSQMQQITDTEQVDSTPYTNATLKGISNIGQLKELWQNTLAQRSNAQFHVTERFLFRVRNNDRSPDFKNWIKSIQETIAETNGSPQLIQMLNELQEGTFNLPSHYEKFEQYFNAHFSDAFLHKIPSYKTTLVSDLGYKVLEDENGKIITSRMYNEKPDYYEELIAKGKVKPRDLAYEKTEKDSQGNERTYSEFMLPMHFAEQFGLKPGDEIPESIAYMFGLRIPTQDHHSALSLKLVDILPSEAGSNAVFPKEIILMTGSDFDIDSFYIHRPDHYVKGEGESARFLQYGNTEDSEFEQYKNWQLTNNKILKKLINYFKQDSDFADKYQDRNDLVKKIKRDIKNLHHQKYELIERLKAEQKILDAMNTDLERRAFKELDLPLTEEEYKVAQAKGMEFNIGKLNNILLESKIAFQTNEHITKEITKTPASLTALEDVLGDLADVLLGDAVQGLSNKDKISKLDKDFDMFGMNAFAQALDSNKAGKESIGAAVNSTQAFTFLNKYGLEVNKEGVIIINGKPLSNYRDSLNSEQVRIMDLLSTLTSAMTDNGKWGFVAKCNLTLNTLGIASDFVMRGGKFKDAIFMLNTKFIKQYSKDVEGNGLQSSDETKNSKFRVAKEVYKKLYANIKSLTKEVHGIELENADIAKFSNDISSEELEWLVRNGVEENFSKLSKEDQLKYYELELRNFNNYTKLEKFNGNLISVSQILTLTKGLNTTHAESDIILEHLNKLGIRLTLNPDNTVSVVPTANENPPFVGFMNALLKHKLTLTNLKNLTKVLHNASYVQINRTPAFRSMFDIIKHNTSKWLTNRKFTYGKISKNLMSFLTIKAYRKFLEESTGRTLDLNGILYAKDDNNLYERYAELMKDAEFSTNRFVLSLNVRPPADNGFIEITANTHSNKNKGFEERILDGYEALLVHSNPAYVQFANDMYFYECSKNGFQFKTGSFINYVAPAMFKRISESSKTVNLLMRNNFETMQDEDCKSVFGLDKENLVKEFVTLYAGDINNSNDAKYVTSSLENKFAISTNSTENMFTFDLYKDTKMQHDPFASFSINDMTEDIVEKTTPNEKITKENAAQIKGNSEAMGRFFDRVSVGEKSYFKFPLWFRQGENRDSIFRLVTVNNRVISYTGEPVYVGTKAVYEKIKMFGERSKASTYARTTPENNEVEIQHVFSSKKEKEKRATLESRVGNIEDTSRMHEAFPDDEFDDFPPEEIFRQMNAASEVAKAITGDPKDQKKEDQQVIEEEGQKKVTECKVGNSNLLGKVPDGMFNTKLD